MPRKWWIHPLLKLKALLKCDLWHVPESEYWTLYVFNNEPFCQTKFYMDNSHTTQLNHKALFWPGCCFQHRKMFSSTERTSNALATVSHQNFDIKLDRPRLWIPTNSEQTNCQLLNTPARFALHPDKPRICQKVCIICA